MTFARPAHPPYGRGMSLLTTIRQFIREARESAARFEHRGVVVSYRGVVLDQTAVVGAIDAAADALPKGMDTAPCLARIRVSIYRDDLPEDAAGRSLLSLWTGGYRNTGHVKVTAGPGLDEAIRRGVEALLRSELDAAWVMPPLNERVF